MEIIRRLEPGIRVGVLAAVVVLLVVAAAIQNPIPQPTSYHRFADHRAWFGIRNFVDVVSNLGFLAVGILGLRFLLRGGRFRPTFHDAAERWPYVAMFAAVGLTCFGSMYYHLAPSNARLVWDRLPLSLIFLSLLAATIAERVSLRAGLAALPPLLTLGLVSVVQWWVSETRGAGDLRFYLLVQILPLMLVPLILLLFPARYTRGADLLVAVGFYTGSKIFELFDRELYRAGHIVSGHTIKHLAAAFAAYWVLRMLRRRQAVAAPRGMAAAAD